jgi:1-acyl-sn-glycerol-3-phosphate acyltransferase
MSKKLRKPRGLRLRAQVITHTVRTFLRSAAKVRIFRVKVDNRKVVPRKGRVIIACNHPSIADPVYLWGAIPRTAPSIAKAELWKIPGVNLLLWLLECIKIKRGDPDSAKKTIMAGTRILEHDGPLIIFPEGGCSPAPFELRKLKTGMARMAIATDSPIMAAGIVGTHLVAPLHGRWIRWWKQVYINFSDHLIYPKDFAHCEDPVAALTDAVNAEILKRMHMPVTADAAT